MSDLFVAWDLETCPFDFDTYTDAQNERYDTELRIRSNRRPDEPRSSSSRLVRSVHPFLGWICCISAVSGTAEGGPNQPRSWTAATPDAEDVLLSRFWDAVAGFNGSVTWVTFNGKRFDVPFLTARSLHHGIAPTRGDLLDTYPYNHRPHADLSNLWPQHYRLADLCDLLGVDSPKKDIDGSQVADAVAEGRIEEVAQYGRADVQATFACMQAATPLLVA
jgi:DNA polymerase elongation subunit (family B)